MNLDRLYLAFLFPLLVLDCAGNMLIGGSFRNTLSAEAWHARDHDWWFWTHAFIDGLFFWQHQHCRAQADRERRHGSVWTALAVSWRSAA